MANFCYKAISAKGKTVRGLVEADTERQAIASVREKGACAALRRIRVCIRCQSGNAFFQELLQKNP